MLPGSDRMHLLGASVKRKSEKGDSGIPEICCVCSAWYVGYSPVVMIRSQVFP